MKKNEELVNQLIDLGNSIVENPYFLHEFTKNKEANRLLNDLENYPHAYVIACLMDSKKKSEKTWLIPYELSKSLGDFKFDTLLNVSLEDYEEIFNSQKLHFFYNKMAGHVYNAIKLISSKYHKTAFNIWNDVPSSATLVKRFREFKGAGPKISTMASNILIRSFKIKLKDYKNIDISVDTHIRRVFKRFGFVSKDASDNEIILTVRELYPSYPGVFDFSTWDIGVKYCRPNKPDCINCYVNKNCPKLL